MKKTEFFESVLKQTLNEGHKFVRDPVEDVVDRAMEILQELIDDGQLDDDEEIEMMEQEIQEGDIEGILMTLSPWGYDTIEDLMER